MATAEMERTDAGDCCRFPYTAARTAAAPERESEIARKAADCRAGDRTFAHWAEGYGPIAHGYETQVRSHALAHALAAEGCVPDGTAAYRLLAALHRAAAVTRATAERSTPPGCCSPIAAPGRMRSRRRRAATRNPSSRRSALH